jgi:hypothetical protein
MKPNEKPIVAFRGLVLATIEPSGPKTSGSREHELHLRLEMSSVDVKRADTGYVIGLVRDALTGFVEGEACAFIELPASKVGGKVTTIEGKLALSERPSDDAIEHLGSTLHTAGYGVTLRETRECDQAGCSSRVVVGWNRSSTVPSGWYDQTICGKHAYRRCSGCKSTYTMSSSNATGQAPSLHCEVCGAVLIEWGGTKLWSAELVKVVAGE